MSPVGKRHSENRRPRDAMMLELHLYNPDAGFDAAGVPLEVTRSVTVNLPPPAVPNRYDRWTPDERAQAMADLLDAMAYGGEP